MKHKLVKVTFEYDDAIETLEDKAQEWLDEVNSYISIHALRNSTGGMSEYDWKVQLKKGR
jgi:hypothetical protein